MTISVIIPTYNGADRIGGVLERIIEWSADLHEIIVVDDGSTDNTLEVLEQYDSHIRIVSQSNRGRAGARNTGSREARGSHLWFLDDDMKPEPGGPGIIHGHFQDHQESILVGGQFEDPRECTNDFQRYKAHLSAKWQSQLGAEKTKLSRPYITAANMAIPKSLFEELGEFDEDLTDLEDYDLALRATENEKPIFFDPKLLGWHQPPESVYWYLERLNQYEKIRKKIDPQFQGESTSATTGRFSSTKWLDRIHNEKLLWIPKVLRYRLYDRILFANIRA